MEIPGELPKRYTYIKNLSEHNPKSVKLWTGWISWIKNKVPHIATDKNHVDLQSDKTYTRIDLTEVIGTKGGDWEYAFLDDLIEDGILEKVGTHDGTDVYVFTRNWDKKLAKQIEQDEKWDELREISKFVFNKAEGKELI